MRRIRHLFSLLLMAAFCLMLSAGVREVSAETLKGSCGIGVNWQYDTETKTMVVTGNGEMKDWDNVYDIPWREYQYKMETVIIGNGVTNVGDYSFENYTKLKSITLPEGLTRIGDHAFAGSIMEYVDIPDTVEEIDNNAFYGCEELLVVDMPKNLKRIGDFAFANCKKVTSFYLADGVTTIGENAFRYCESLESIVLPPSVETLGEGAFSFAFGLKSVVLSDAIPAILDSTFYECAQLVSVNIPTGTKTIGGFAFGGCEKLRGVILPEGLTSIGNYAFQLSGIRQLVVPSTVIQLGQGCFYGCDYLARIAFLNPDTTAKYDSATSFGKAGVTTIYGYKDSVAFDYAYDHGFAFEYLTEENLWKDMQGILNAFEDVEDSQFFYDSVLWAVQNGITTGYTETVFAPFDVCTRGQMVTFLWRTAGKPSATITDCTFQDVDASAFYYDAMLWAVENGITTGYNPETFAPHDICTRAQVVTFLWRANGKEMPGEVKHDFYDVTVGDFYYDAMLWALENKITTGKSVIKFAPHDSCSRAEVVTFLQRADK